jgi:hypothetical protein
LYFVTPLDPEWRGQLISVTSKIADTELAKLDRLIKELGSKLENGGVPDSPSLIAGMSDVMRAYCSGVGLTDADAFVEKHKELVLERPILQLFPCMHFILFERLDSEHFRATFDVLRKTVVHNPYKLSWIENELFDLYSEVFDFIQTNRYSTLSVEGKRERIRELIDRIKSVKLSSDLARRVRAILLVRVGLNDIAEVDSLVMQTKPSAQLLEQEVVQEYNIPDEAGYDVGEVEEYYREETRVLAARAIKSGANFGGLYYVKQKQQEVQKKYDRIVGNRAPTWAKIILFVVGAIFIIGSVVLFDLPSVLARAPLQTNLSGISGLIIGAIIIVVGAVSQNSSYQWVFYAIATARYWRQLRYWRGEAKRLSIDVNVNTVLFKS